MFQLGVDDETLTNGIGLFLPGNFDKRHGQFGIEVSLSYDTGIMNTAQVFFTYTFFLHSIFFYSIPDMCFEIFSALLMFIFFKISKILFLKRI